MLKLASILLSFLFASVCFSQIQIAEPKFDFGEILEEKGIVYADFKLVNPYPNDSIEILSIETSCGCTIVMSHDSIIEPRSALNLKVSYNPTGRAGLFNKSVQIYTKTGNNEYNSLFLKLVGNVVPKFLETKVSPSLIKYKISPIYFYPITPYDTSYLDFNYIIDFINEVSYETDFYQFSKVGFEVSVRDNEQIEKLEYLIRFSKYKFLHEMDARGYGKDRLFFKTPIFIKDESIPKWAVAKIKAYSVNFNSDEIVHSEISLTNQFFESQSEFILDYRSNHEFLIDSIKSRIDFNELDKKIISDSILDLNIDLKIPESYSLKNAEKFKKSLQKMLYSELKKSSGIEKSELILNYDSIYFHASTKFYLKVWQNQDLEVENDVSYQEKQDQIISPFLPTLKQKVWGLDDEIDIMSSDFKHFWNCLLRYRESAEYLTIVLESATSFYPKGVDSDPLYHARQRGDYLKTFLKNKYEKETGKDITIEVKHVLLGPKYNKRNFTKRDYENYEYIKIVPLFKEKRNLPIPKVNVRPYLVNYDYYFVGIDTNSFIFKKFAKYVIYQIQTEGMIELKVESSASRIPVDKNKSNQYLAYKHLEESKKRLFDYLESHLVDPNRVLITEERVLVQGIPFSKKTPIVRYKKYQYVTFVPTNFLINK